MNNDIYESFKALRRLDEDIDGEFSSRKDNEKIDAVPYTSQDTLMTNTLESAKQEFGADFNNIKNPMLYYPSDGDITLSGVIPEMNDAKFQFRYKVGDGAGCYVWSNPYLPISDKTIQTLSKVNGVCKNWRDEISKSEDCKPSNYRDPDDQQDNQQGQATQNVGDEKPAATNNEQPQGNNMNEDVNFFRKTIDRLNEAGIPQTDMDYEPGDDFEKRNSSVEPGDDFELFDNDDSFGQVSRLNEALSKRL